MEKIVVALDAENPDPHALDFACYVANLTKSKVTGAFLENLIVDEVFVLQEGYEKKEVNWEVDKNSETYRHKQEVIRKNVDLFKDACERRSVRCNVHSYCGDPAREMIRESRFADLIVLDAETTFNKAFEGVPGNFLKSVLREAECPVIVAPESFDGIDEIVLTYNGSKSSMFAIKQFCYLFPELDDKKITVLQIDEEDHLKDVEKDKFKEWISDHYSSIGFETLKGDAETELFAHLLKKRNVFIVMGAYGRSTISQFFKHSRADLLLKTITQAIFIAHC